MGEMETKLTESQNILTSLKFYVLWFQINFVKTWTEIFKIDLIFRIFQFYSKQYKFA